MPETEKLQGVHRFAVATASVTVLLLMAGALVPAVYSLVFYKQLERRGEL